MTSDKKTKEKRKRITIECKDDCYLDIELWNELQKYSNPSGIIKDMLKSLVALPNLKNKEED